MTAEREQVPPPRRTAETPIARDDKREALARLSGGMAHDFNNILHVIKSVIELLRQRVGATDPEVPGLIDMLARNAARGTRLTRELLAFSARQPLAPVALSPNRLIADMQHRLREALGRGTQVETMLGGSLWNVEADPGELEIVVQKLAENGRDAMPGGGTVTIETANTPLDPGAAARLGIAPGDYVAISVRDSGSGMSAEVLSRAFDPYFTTKEPGSMIGLGLSRVYGFVTQVEGHITVDSTPGEGTRVTLYLPRHQQPVTDAGVPKVVPLGAKPMRQQASVSLAGLRVLVVEDESLIGMLAEDLLEQLGCRMVGLVSSIARALEIVKTAEVDFALLDVDIGGEPVYPVARALEASHVPFLFMSGYGGLDGPWRGRPIVHKPFDLEQLRKEIERALRGAG